MVLGSQAAIRLSLGAALGHELRRSVAQAGGRLLNANELRGLGVAAVGPQPLTLSRSAGRRAGPVHQSPGTVVRSQVGQAVDAGLKFCQSPRWVPFASAVGRDVSETGPLTNTRWR